MFHLILTACLAGSAGTCAPVLLPAGYAADLAGCESGAGQIASGWLSRHDDLAGRGTDCVATDDLPALELHKIAPGLFVFQGDPVQLEDSGDGRIANLGVVIGGASVAVIDSGVSRAQGQELYAAIRRLTDKPVSHVILTHAHPDHVLGTAVFQEAGATVIGHRALPLALELRAGSYLDSMDALFPPEQMLGTGIVLPDATVDDVLEIDLGARRLTLTAAPTAHTDSDLTVFDHASATLFSGDLIFRLLTPILDGSLSGWLQWLDTPPDPAPRRIVPGHGPVAATWAEAVGPQTRFLRALEHATRARILAGQPMSQAVPEIVHAMQDMAAGWNAFDASVARDATAAYKELEWQ
ncbi:quinoprotein relay system zinc metallohydrolase 2 [Paracoccus stylophorae]|uniref:Quinoprotein relay system zinc metallohydrolase 2 n=1 Tax=Paracoccus stylophorae TaxID=659350 RepID=A0ABY7SWE8_9RHOB|nr:quinoprotein relay system zinc metallohydrolase 2 [Paracoccus stylophorae]WCR11341.1 quinoprotein relay system zinc metallohydrolase 2 [Paracoccus stylophorae]